MDLLKPVFLEDDESGTPIGEAVKTKKGYVFFGNNACTPNLLYQKFPEYSFSFLNQVHGNTLVPFNAANKPEADAHFSKKSLEAPVIRTADCMPILLISDSVACSIHAGWKGLINGVITKSINQISFEADTYVYIGPHILQKSFEVGTDVAQQIISYSQNFSNFLDLRSVTNDHKNLKKKFLNLSAIAKAELISLGLKPSNINVSSSDTFANSKYNSARREPSNSKRNLSFCCLL